MRNPFKSYWFVSVDRYSQQGDLVSKHFRLFYTWRWLSQFEAWRKIEHEIAKDLGCDKDRLLLASMSRN